MSFPSCIKMPVSKSETPPENKNFSSFGNDHASIIYYELISIANEIFGHGNWSHSITSQTIDYVEYTMGKYQVGCAAFVKVQMNNGTFHEDMGYSSAEHALKGSAIQSARTLSITRALRKVLICFGGEIESKIIKIQIERQKVKNLTVASLSNNKDNDKPVSTLSKSNSSVDASKDLEKKEIVDKKDIAASKIQATKPIASTSNNQSPKPSTSTDNEQKNSIVPQVMSEEDQQRIERKRKQKQKQDEYKRQMTEKLKKKNETENSK